MATGPGVASILETLGMLDATSLGWTSGVLLVGAAALRAAWGTVTLRQRTRHRERSTHIQRAEFAEQLHAALQWARASHPRLKAWLGLRSFRVVRVTEESADCRSYYLAPVDGAPLARFAPGQYLTFHLPIGEADRPVVRCYSLSDRPREDAFRVTVKRALPPAADHEIPPGLASSYFHDGVGEGSVLEAEAPQGAFFLDPTDDLPVVLIGGGIGVTPLLSMAAAMTYQADRRIAHWLVGFRNGDEHPFRNEIARLVALNRRLKVDVSYSQPRPSDRLGHDFDHHGRVDAARLRQVLPSNNFRFYVCGPCSMMESLVPDLLAWGVPREHIHFEAFGPATVQGLGTVGSEPCDVQFARSAQTVRWHGDQTSLLALAEGAGVEIDSGCRAGSCGQCRVRVVAGKVIHAKPPGVELVDGECLACIAAPEGDVVLEA